jgi:hypothetical protein
MAVSKKVEAMTEMLAPAVSAVVLSCGVRVFPAGAAFGAALCYIDGPEGVYR